jgi:GNAT superfamily N-acetyltransferase
MPRWNGNEVVQTRYPEPNFENERCWKAVRLACQEGRVERNYRMSGLTLNNPKALAEGIRIRAEEVRDDALLFAVYASTRADELSATDWDEATCQAFLQMQFAAQRQGYRSMFPDAEFSVVLVGEQPAGRIVVNRTDQETLLVDIALLPEFQGRGVGGVLVEALIEEARAAAKTLRVSVLKGNRAAVFYRRLGFVQTGESGFYDLWAWRPPADVNSPG